ncbi:MAG TPA: hypothetical protein VHA78_00140 [Candidatus Peribacteraceae bacterium]|nr:hypothetical protein [Candidatus Peribacteraceae bacterium]
MDETQPPYQPQEPVREIPSVVRPPSNDVSENKDLAALSYAWVLSVFLFFWKKDSPFVRFHARQGMVLFAISLIAWFIPIVNRAIELLVLAFCVFGFLGAAQGQWKDLPIIGDLASGRLNHVRASWREIVGSCARLWRRITHAGKKKAEQAQEPTPTQAQPESPVHPNPNPNPPSL